MGYWNLGELPNQISVTHHWCSPTLEMPGGKLCMYRGVVEECEGRLDGAMAYQETCPLGLQ